MNKHKEYAQIKLLIDIYFHLEQGKRYEDFILELARILDI